MELGANVHTFVVGVQKGILAKFLWGRPTVAQRCFLGQSSRKATMVAWVKKGALVKS